MPPRKKAAAKAAAAKSKAGSKSTPTKGQKRGKKQQSLMEAFKNATPPKKAKASAAASGAGVEAAAQLPAVDDRLDDITLTVELTSDALTGVVDDELDALRKQYEEKVLPRRRRKKMKVEEEKKTVTTRHQATAAAKFNSSGGPEAKEPAGKKPWEIKGVGYLAVTQKFASADCTIASDKLSHIINLMLDFEFQDDGSTALSAASCLGHLLAMHPPARVATFEADGPGPAGRPYLETHSGAWDPVAWTYTRYGGTVDSGTAQMCGSEFWEACWGKVDEVLVSAHKAGPLPERVPVSIMGYVLFLQYAMHVLEVDLAARLEVASAYAAEARACPCHGHTATRGAIARCRPLHNKLHALLANAFLWRLEEQGDRLHGVVMKLVRIIVAFGATATGGASPSAVAGPVDGAAARGPAGTSAAAEERASCSATSVAEVARLAGAALQQMYRLYGAAEDLGMMGKAGARARSDGARPKRLQLDSIIATALFSNDCKHTFDPLNPTGSQSGASGEPQLGLSLGTPAACAAVMAVLPHRDAARFAAMHCVQCITRMHFAESDFCNPLFERVQAYMDDGAQADAAGAYCEVPPSEILRALEHKKIARQVFDKHMLVRQGVNTPMDAADGLSVQLSALARSAATSAAAAPPGPGARAEVAVCEPLFAKALEAVGPMPRSAAVRMSAAAALLRAAAAAH